MLPAVTVAVEGGQSLARQHQRGRAPRLRLDSQSDSISAASERRLGQAGKACEYGVLNFVLHQAQRDLITQYTNSRLLYRPYNDTPCGCFAALTE